jgi:hypothetical protein
MQINAISVAARNLRAYMASKLGLSEDNILIGHPSVAAGTAEADANKGQFINIFFYRVEYGAYPPNGSKTDPFYVRLFCLITALGNNETGDGGTITVSAGENDLRLIGGVMQHLHASPILEVKGEDDKTVAQLQVVISPLDVNDMHNIWATQGDTPYRLSVAYELALAPIPLATAKDTSKRVARIGVEVKPDLSYPSLSETGLGIKAQPDYAGKITIRTDQETWAPHLILLNPANRPVYSLLLDSAAVPSQVPVIALGNQGDSVFLAWEQWHSQEGWHKITPEPEPTINLSGAQFDPAGFNSALAVNIDLPSTNPGQLLLYALRRISKIGGRKIVIRSNPLLITIIQESSS